jgi:hypothetical protein
MIKTSGHMDPSQEFETALERTAVAPPGWEKTVKKMKKHPEISNPWALAWHMKNKGYTPGGKKASEADAYEHALQMTDAFLAERVAARFMLAKDFPTEKAKKQYLKDHPKANPADHKVVQKPSKELQRNPAWMAKYGPSRETRERAKLKRLRHLFAMELDTPEREG